MDDQDEKRDEFPAGFEWRLDWFMNGQLYYRGKLVVVPIAKEVALAVTRTIADHIVAPAVEEATRELQEELDAAREEIARLQEGQARTFPPGFSFDPYQGEGLGCLRHESIPFKIVDDVVEAAALRYAKTLAGVAEKPEEGPGMSLHLMSVEIDGVQQPVYHVPCPGDAPAKESLVYLDVQETAAERLDLLWDAGEVIAWLKADLAEANARAEKAETYARNSRDIVQTLRANLDRQTERADANLEAFKVERAMHQRALDNWRRRTWAVERECKKVASAWCDIASGITADIRHIEGIVQNPLPAPAPRKFPVVGTYDPPPENYAGIYINDNGLRGPLAYVLSFAFSGDDSAETLEEAQALAREYQAIIATTDGWGE